jgi:hypothetical protein
LYGSDEAIPMLGDRLDVARPGGAVAEATPQDAHRLGDGFIGDRDAVPDAIHQLLLGDQVSCLRDEHRECIQIARPDLDRYIAVEEAPIGDIQGEGSETIDVSVHSSAKPHVLLTSGSCSRCCLWARFRNQPRSEE